MHLELLCFWPAFACQVRIKGWQIWLKLLRMCEPRSGTVGVIMFGRSLQSKTKNISQHSEGFVCQPKIHLTSTNRPRVSALTTFWFFLLQDILDALLGRAFLLSLVISLSCCPQWEVKVEEPASCCPVCKKRFSGLSSSAVKKSDATLILQ